MVTSMISRKSADQPVTFPYNHGTKATYTSPNNSDIVQEKKIISDVPQQQTPVENPISAAPVNKLVRTGVEQVGLQEYRRPTPTNP